jgi:hypothetical protein
MPAIYKVYNFRFDLERFGYDLKRCKFVNDKTLAAMLGLDASTVNNWKNHARSNTETPYPSMTNFLKVCNLLDLDPREYFVLETDNE